MSRIVSPLPGFSTAKLTGISKLKSPRLTRARIRAANSENRRPHSDSSSLPFSITPHADTRGQFHRPHSHQAHSLSIAPVLHISVLQPLCQVHQQHPQASATDLIECPERRANPFFKVRIRQIALNTCKSNITCPFTTKQVTPRFQDTNSSIAPPETQRRCRSACSRGTAQ